jgi:hypothetical protein
VFSTILIIWSGNLRKNHEYCRMQAAGSDGHRPRVRHSRCLLPAPVRGIKRHGVREQVAIAVSARYLLDLFWLIAPGRTTKPLVADGRRHSGHVVRALCRPPSQLRRRPLPVHDPQFEEALGPVLAHGANQTAH